MGAEVAHFVAVFKTDLYDPLQSGLSDGDDAGVLQMLSEKHAECRSLQRCLAADFGQVDQGERRIGGQIEADLAASPFRSEPDREDEFIFIGLCYFINTAAGQRILKLSAKTCDGDSIKCHNASPVFRVFSLTQRV